MRTNTIIRNGLLLQVFYYSVNLMLLVASIYPFTLSFCSEHLMFNNIMLLWLIGRLGLHVGRGQSWRPGLCHCLYIYRCYYCM